MKFKAFAAVSAVVLGSLAVLAGGSPQAHAASAIMVDQRTGAYGYCAGASDPYAAMTCAQERCEAAGGRNCEVVEGCPLGGHGAVARDRSARLVGGSCGMPSEAQARARAMQSCVQAGAANCQISEVFVEERPGAAQSASVPQPSAPAPQPSAPAKGGAPGTSSQSAPAAQPSQPVQEQPVTRQPAQQQSQPAPKPEPQAPPEAATEPSAGQPAEQPARQQADREEATKGVVDSLRQRSEPTTQQASLTDEQQALADNLIGVWSSRDCAEKFWRITKVADLRYNVFVWYDDGQENQTEFEVSFEDEYMVLTWDTRLPNTAEGMERGRRYVEKIGNIETDAYVVVENNYKDFNRPWTVHRCTEKR